MTTHLTDDELILHYYGETDGVDTARIESHLAACAECQHANERLRQVMIMVDSAAPVEAPAGLERTAWARLEPALDRGWLRSFADSVTELVRRSSGREGGWALAGGVAALVLTAFVAGRYSGGVPARVTPTPAAVADASLPERVLRAEVGDHLDRTQMMLVELVNADSGQTDVFAGEQARAANLVAANRLIRQSVTQSGDAAVADMLEDLERLLLEIANAPANASSNDLSDLQSRITTEDLLFRVRVMASEMRQRAQQDRGTGDRVTKKMPIS
jgi:hypothetical protein